MTNLEPMAASRQTATTINQNLSDYLVFVAPPFQQDTRPSVPKRQLWWHPWMAASPILVWL